MTDKTKLKWVRLVHTAIYITMAAATIFILSCGITGWQPWPLPYAVGLLLIESGVFVGNGFKCPLTKMAVKYGAETGHVGDTFLPVKVTQYTFRVFGTMLIVGLALVAWRMVGVGA